MHAFSNEVAVHRARVGYRCRVHDNLSRLAVFPGWSLFQSRGQLGSLSRYLFYLRRSLMNKPLIKLFRSLPADDSKRHLFATDFSLFLPAIYNLCRSFSVTAFCYASRQNSLDLLISGSRFGYYGCTGRLRKWKFVDWITHGFTKFVSAWADGSRDISMATYLSSEWL